MRLIKDKNKLQIKGTQIKQHIYTDQNLDDISPMGQFFSVDKHVSNLDDILELNPRLLASTRFQSTVPSQITHHLKIWKFFEEDSKTRAVNCIPANLSSLSTVPLLWNEHESYLVLLVSQKHNNDSTNSNKRKIEPISQALYQTVQSGAAALTPRGLRTSAADNCSSGAGRSNCQPPNNNNSNIQNSVASGSEGAYDYQLYVYNGKKCYPHVRNQAFMKCFELEKLIASSEQMLPILFGGGVLRNKKLQKGSVIQLTKEEVMGRNPSSFMSSVDILNCVYINSTNSPIANLLSFVARPIMIVNAPQQQQMKKPQVGIPPLINIGNNAFSNNSSQVNTVPTLSTVPIPPTVPSLGNVGSNNSALSQTGPQKLLKTPLLNLSLKPFQQTRYQQIQQETVNGIINFDIRATARHQLKMQKFENECSEILEGLYVSGEKVAKDIETIRKKQITHVVNCAADYCENWFQSEGVNYLAFFLKDSQNESIECLFYKVIEFIDDALRNKKKVLVHCIQGISRSVTMIIAYVMFTMKFDYKTAEAFVKQRRGVASPNNGFMVQLIQFHKRLYEDFGSLPSPRIFLVSSHCKETPEIITARLLKYQIFQKRKNIGLDCRGLYIIQMENSIYLWIGSKCDGVRLDKYFAYAQQYIKKLQKFEKAPKGNVNMVAQGEEGEDFYRMWGLDTVPAIYENPEYNNLFPNIQPDGVQILKPGANRKHFSNETEEEDPKEKIKYKLFIYPDATKALGVFEAEDLSGLSILFKESNKQQLECFLWRQRDTSVSQDQQKEFLDFLVQNYYGHINSKGIYLYSQNEGKESQEFLDCFQ